MMFFGARFSSKSEPHNNENSICFAGDQTDKNEIDKEPDTERPKSQGNKLVEVNLAGKNEEPRPIFLSTCLPEELKDKMLALLEEFRDVFAWTNGDVDTPFCTVI